MVNLIDKQLVSSDGIIDVEAWLQHILEKRQRQKLTQIKHAATLARLIGEEQATPYGDSCLHQGFTIANILSDLNIDDDTLTATFIYSCVQHADLSLDDVEEHFGPAIKKLIQNTKQLDGISDLYAAVSHHNHQHPKIDVIRKMFLAMVDDIRAVLIKLAEHLAIMRTIKNYNPRKQQLLANETSAIYAPLANRLGIGHIKWELEDLAFRYLETDKYKEISKGLNQRRIDRDLYVANFITKLKDILHSANIENPDVYGRAKHIYSIYRKMQRKDVDLSEVYDALAVRVLVPTLDDCYQVLSQVHATWQHIPQEFDDYVSAPKPNGYQSIHTAIIGPENKNIEIQIRTYEMHEKAELGVAAHWIYKEGPQKSSDYEAKIAWLREIMAWQKEVTATEDKLDDVHKIFEDRVYVFTPSGEVIDLPTGATPLDFAYHIHSEVGHRCRGAKINNHIVNLTYKLRTGDRVEIITTKQGRPSRDWLNPHLGFIKTSKAKAKIHQWFKKQNYDKNITEGQEQLEKEFKRLGLKNINISHIASSLHHKKPEEMYAAIATGEIKLSAVINLIQRQDRQAKEDTAPPQVVQPTTDNKPSDIEIQGIGSLLTTIAKCCSPIPGDDIIGYITQGRGVSIHKKECPNILRAQNIRAEKLVEVNWGTKSAAKYPVNLAIIAYDRAGLIKDISNLIANEKLNLIGLTSNVDRQEHLATIHLTIEIDGLNSLSKITTKISQLANIIEIKRN
ncbi:MAG: GTP diphosphokinase [Gammaproteobacteria bacterium]|nr:GTP diphosphokinase [Gammaproteobacteria bacterium]